MYKTILAITLALLTATVLVPSLACNNHKMKNCSCAQKCHCGTGKVCHCKSAVKS